MSCVEIPADVQAALDQLAAQDGIGPVEPELADAVETLRGWGWVFGPQPELSGIGRQHATARHHGHTSSMSS